MAKGSSGFDKSGNKNSALIKNAKKMKVETYYRRKGMGGSYYGDIVVEAKEDPRNPGHIEFSSARGDFSNNNPKANTQDVTFEITHGAVTHSNSGRTVFHGINWDKVKSVSGKTYDIKNYIKEKGFKWDGTKKMWVRK